MSLVALDTSQELVSRADAFSLDVSGGKYILSRERVGGVEHKIRCGFSIATMSHECKPGLFVMMWRFMHRLLSPAGWRFVPATSSFIDTFGTNSGRFVDDVEAYGYTIRAGDRIAVRIGIDVVNGVRIDVALYRGGDVLTSVAEIKKIDGAVSNGHLFELQVLAIMVMAQHLNPRGLSVCAFKVHMTESVSPLQRQEMQRLLNRVLAGYGTDGVNSGVAKQLAGVDYVVMPIGTPTP